MDHRQVRRYWNANADAWTRLARAGYDTYRDHLNTPAFFDMLSTRTMTRLACIPIGGAIGYRLLAVDRFYKFAVVGFMATLANFCAYIARIPSRIILEITSQKQCKE